MQYTKKFISADLLRPHFAFTPDLHRTFSAQQQDPNSRITITMIGLRRVALRVLSKPSTTLLCRSRAINTATPFTARSKLQGLSISQLQRRFASEEAQTQSEPSADRTEEGQHGDNSIAASSEPTQADDPVPGQAYGSQPAQPEQSKTLGDFASAAAETTREAASNAYGAVADLASGSGRASNKPDTPPGPSVYVGNLFFDVREDDLRREFEKVGAIESVKVIVDNRGLSKGFAYVNFTDVATAQSAIDNYNNQPFEGRRLTVQFAAVGRKPAFRSHSDLPSEPTRTLFIGNMAFDMSDRELNNLFREIRNVVDVRVAIDRRTGQPRGFAHADFTDIESAKEAMVVLAGKEVCGRSLRVDYSRSQRFENPKAQKSDGQKPDARQEGY